MICADFLFFQSDVVFFLFLTGMFVLGAMTGSNITCFPVNIAKFSTIPLSKNICKHLLPWNVVAEFIPFWHSISSIPCIKVNDSTVVKTINDTLNYLDIGAATGGVLLKKVFLEISQNSQENICARVSFLIKLQALGLRFLSM